MNKIFKFHEWLGTGIQLMIFAVLCPFVAVILSLLEFPGDAKSSFVESVMSFLPLSEYMEGIIHGINLSKPGIGFVDYALAALNIVTENIEAFMFVGMWLYAFRVIFSELLVKTIKVGKMVSKVVPIFSGIPIIQVTLGLFFPHSPIPCSKIGCISSWSLHFLRF